VAFGLLALALISGGAWAERGEVVETVGDGAINWSKGIILAKGSGAPPRAARNIAQARLMTERAALTDARRNLLEVLKGVRVDSSTLVENFMVKDDQIRLQAEGFIQGSVEVRRLRRYLSDGAIEVTVAMDLAGDFLSLMLKAEARKGVEKPLPPVAMEPKPEKKVLPPQPPQTPSVAQPPPPPSPSPVAPQPPAAVPEKKSEPASLPARVGEKSLPNPADLPPFTGMVLDARGLGMKPALVVRVLDQSGMELYRGNYVPPEKAAQNGLALFSRDLTAAQTNPRVGKNPLTIKGWKVNPATPSDVILGEENAREIAPYAQKGTFLEDCRVMVVLE
jgi:hypothetical protein